MRHAHKLTLGWASLGALWEVYLFCTVALNENQLLGEPEKLSMTRPMCMGVQ